MFYDLKEICLNCGFTKGSHKATACEKFPRNCCPGTPGRMDWDNGAGTTFSPSGIYQDDPKHTITKPNNLEKTI